MSKNRCWRLRSRPVGEISVGDLELCVEDMPAASASGEMLIKNLFVSIDPTHRIWMSDKAQYMPPVALGDVMRAATVGVVVSSNDPAFAVGQHVVGFGGVAEHYVGVAGQNVYYPVAADNLTQHLSVLSIIVGLTAWHGVNKVLTPSSGEVLVVSAGAGAVGSLVGQLAKLRGAKVVGIAGSAAKCSFMKDVCGFDATINYKTDDVKAAVSAFAPDGIQHYFDNVGGPVTDAVLQCMKNNGRVCVCGSISEYDDKWTGQTQWNMILMRRLTVSGFICVDHMSEFAEATSELGQLVKEGRLKYVEDVREGLDNYIDTVKLLLSGANDGKLILKI